MGISTHVLDTAIGRPAAGVAITLDRLDDGAWTRVASGSTNDDGRIDGGLVGDQDLRAAAYRISFASGAYFEARGERSFYPEVSYDFVVHDASQHYHVPLLVSPWSFSTYRGS